MIKNIFSKPINILVLIKSKTFGNNFNKLGTLLIKNFLISLNEYKKNNIELIFINEGVFLVTLDDFLPILMDLKNNKIKISSCGTCIDFYNLKKDIKIGELTNMYHITELLLNKKIQNIII